MSTPISSVPLLFERLRAARLDLLEHVGELLAEEDRDDRGGSLVRAEAVVVGRGRDHGAQEAAELVHGADDGATEHQELRVVVRRVARVEQVALGGVAERVVDVLARAIDARERLLVKQADQAVTLGDRLQRDHHQLLVIGREVRALEDGSHFELARARLRCGASSRGRRA